MRRLEECVGMPDMVITQDMLDREDAAWNEKLEYLGYGLESRLGDQRVIDGKHVAVVFIKGPNMPVPAPYLRCACDCENILPVTERCARKEQWYKDRYWEIAEEYNARDLTPKAIVLDLFERVLKRGEFLGQRNGESFYVQDAARIFMHLDPKLWGSEEYPISRTSKLFAKELKRIRHNRKVRNLPEPAPEIITFKNLTERCVLKLASELRREKKLSLSGMVFVPYGHGDGDRAEIVAHRKLP